MMLNKMAEWRESSLHDAAKKGISIEFNVIAVYSSTYRSFFISADIDGKGGIFISSQRQEKRGFKTLDAVKRALNSVGIHHFQVLG